MHRSVRSQRDSRLRVACVASCLHEPAATGSGPSYLPSVRAVGVACRVSRVPGAAEQLTAVAAVHDGVAAHALRRTVGGLARRGEGQRNTRANLRRRSLHAWAGAGLAGCGPVAACGRSRRHIWRCLCPAVRRRRRRRTRARGWPHSMLLRASTFTSTLHSTAGSPFLTRTAGCCCCC